MRGCVLLTVLLALCGRAPGQCITESIVCRECASLQ